MIMEWWTSLSVMLKVLWGLTLASSLVFVVQSVMTFVGADSGSDLDSLDMDAGFSVEAADMGHSGMNLYTFRNFINFCLGFGWTSVLLYDSVNSLFLLFLLASLVGIGLVVAVMYMFISAYLQTAAGKARCRSASTAP